MKNIEEKTKEINWNTKDNKQLIEAVLVLRNADEAKSFNRTITINLLSPTTVSVLSQGKVIKELK